MKLEPAGVIKAKIALLLPRPGAFGINRLPASGNNRIYVVSSGDDKWVAKHYFTHTADPRNRLHSEYTFLCFAVDNSITCVPRPVSRDDRSNLALYSFIEGTKPKSSDVTQTAVQSALDFLTELNRHRDHVSTDFPLASEACFSIKTHIDLIESRIERFSAITDSRARRFIQEALRPAWNELKTKLLTEAAEKGIRLGEELNLTERIISPSDFGFHNTLRGKDGRLYFLDFEYAGWDDPAKTVGDFFSHVGVPVSIQYLTGFAQAVANLTPDPVKTRARIDMLLPLYRIKWCCIILNHFLSTEGERRKFSGNPVEEAKAAQLEKARRVLASIKDLSGKVYGPR